RGLRAFFYFCQDEIFASPFPLTFLSFYRYLLVHTFSKQNGEHNEKAILSVFFRCCFSTGIFTVRL
ncbi:hypothetical protein ABM074_02110, partial [Morganella morganii]|uniref:hypothetical protein n=1 Tax=Morganella morganii TaxID=582 RepID=UPI003EBFFFE1